MCSQGNISITGVRPFVRHPPIFFYLLSRKKEVISFCGIGLSIDSCCGIGFFLRISRLQALIPLLLILCKEYKLTERVLYRNRIFGQRERNSRSMSIPKEPEQVMKQRGGSVLGKKTILKSDHFPGCQNKRLSPQIDGAPNYRQVNPQNCFYLLLCLSLSLSVSRFLVSDPVNFIIIFIRDYWILFFLSSINIVKQK